MSTHGATDQDDMGITEGDLVFCAIKSFDVSEHFHSIGS